MVCQASGSEVGSMEEEKEGELRSGLMKCGAQKSE